MPKVFMKVNRNTQVQFYALTFFCLMIILTLFFLTSFQKILEFVMFFDSISLIAAASCIFILRKNKKVDTEKKIYRMKGYPYLPILFVVIYFGVILSVFITNPWSAWWGFVLFIAGLPLYYLIQYLIKETSK
jgi:APA family basic amino acid/polyamine antiporter